MEFEIYNEIAEECGNIQDDAGIIDWLENYAD